MLELADFRGPHMGSVARRLLANKMNPACLRTLDTLRHEEWIELDKAVLDVSRQRMVGIGDLVTRGLTYPLPNALGVTVLMHETVTAFGAAVISMDAAVAVPKDRPDYEPEYLPIPVVADEYSYNVRQLEASRRLGTPLDTTHAAVAAINVAEALETLLFVGTGGVTFGGGTVYGYMNFDHRNTGTCAAHWNDSGADPVADLLAMKQASITDRHYGPWMVYIPSNWETALDDDYNATYPSITVRERLRKIDGILDVKVADKLTADNMVMVEMQPTTVQIVDGMQPTNIEWDERGGLVFNYRVMAIQVPRLRADADGRCGIMHWTK